MKKLLLLLSILTLGNAYGELPGFLDSGNKVEIVDQGDTLKVTVKADRFNAKLDGKHFRTFAIPGTFAETSTTFDLILKKEDCYISESPELVNCNAKEANILITNGKGKTVIDEKFSSVNFETQNRIITWVGGDGHGNPDVRTEESKVVRLSGVSTNKRGILRVEFSNLIRWIE